MHDDRYCYPDSEVLINKLNIRDKDDLFKAEKELTLIRLKELQQNALHPFREGNGRAQREFARLVCSECGYYFDLSHTTHIEMLAASKLSFDKGDSSGFVKIFNKAIYPFDTNLFQDTDFVSILSKDDLTIETPMGYDYYNKHENLKIYDDIYQAKVKKMDAEKIISDGRISLMQKSKELQSVDNIKNIMPKNKRKKGR